MQSSTFRAVFISLCQSYILSNVDVSNKEDGRNHVSLRGGIPPNSVMSPDAPAKYAMQTVVTYSLI